MLNVVPTLELAHQVDRVPGTALAGLGESSRRARHCLNEREKAPCRRSGENYSDTEHTVPELLKSVRRLRQCQGQAERVTCDGAAGAALDGDHGRLKTGAPERRPSVRSRTWPDVAAGPARAGARGLPSAPEGAIRECWPRSEVTPAWRARYSTDRPTSPLRLTVSLRPRFAARLAVIRSSPDRRRRARVPPGHSHEPMDSLRRPRLGTRRWRRGRPALSSSPIRFSRRSTSSAR